MKRFLSILVSLLLVSGLAMAEDAVTSATLKIDKLPAVEAQDNGILVVYFSPDDTVRAAAYTVASALSAELFEIVPEEPYTADDLNYFDSKARSMTEMKDNNARPAIAGLPEDLDKYSTILLGYPIWGGQAPKIILTFLESADLSGKTIIPFCTSNSSGIGSSDTNLHSLTDDSVVWQEGKGVKKGNTAEDIGPKIALAKTADNLPHGIIDTRSGILRGCNGFYQFNCAFTFPFHTVNKSPF